MATVSIILRTDKLKKDGTMPLHFIIIKDRKKSKITTGIFIEPKYWDEKKSRIKPGAPNSARYNSYLQNKLAEMQDEVFEHETVSKSLTARRLKDKVFGKAPTNFFEFSKTVLENYERQKMFGTHDKAQAILNKVEKYHGSKNLMLQDITFTFLDKYEAYCRDKWDNKTNTVHKDMKFIRKVFNDAIRTDIIEMQLNPFLKYKMKTEKTHREFLTEEELEQFANVKCVPGSKMQLHQDMFVFSAYAGGVRVSDLLQLKWKNISNTHINFTIKKTGSQLSIKVPDIAMAIINKYRNPFASMEHYVFSMLPNGLNENDLRLVDKLISGATAQINKNLKEIAKIAEISKPVSFHISRHTFATRALRKGISIDKVSKLMGHAAIRETQIYAKIVSEELDSAMDVFNTSTPVLKIA